MFADIITIGDEILIGQVIDSNSAWIAQQLNQFGIRVRQITSISDEKEAIFEALNQARSHSDIVVTTGGLGPTRDDITKNTLASYFKTDLVMNEEVLADVKAHFENKGMEMPEVNQFQALVPESCWPIRNKNGTAPAMWFEEDGKVIVSLPGVPYEMKSMMSETILPRLKTHFNAPNFYHRTVLTQGVGESTLMGIISKWEDSLEGDGIKLAYLPSPGIVRLRLSAIGDDESAITHLVDRKVDELYQLIPEYIFGEGTETLEKVVGELLKERNQTLSTAESCTGGYIAHLITSVAGSSAYFEGSIVSYANEVKMQQLGVRQEDLKHHGAVSAAVVEQMANGVRQLLQSDYAIATSGVAGPDGGSKEKPVGTVWIAVASPEGVISQRFSFGTNRERNIRKSALQGLSMLRKEILKQS